MTRPVLPALICTLCCTALTAALAPSVLVVGGTGRIGTAVAIHLLQRRPELQVILAGRSAERGAAATIPRHVIHKSQIGAVKTISKGHRAKLTGLSLDVENNTAKIHIEMLIMTHRKRVIIFIIYIQLAVQALAHSFAHFKKWYFLFSNLYACSCSWVAPFSCFAVTY